MSTTLHIPSAPSTGPVEHPTTTQKRGRRTAWIVTSVLAVAVLVAGVVLLVLQPWSSTSSPATTAPSVSAVQLYGTAYGPGSQTYREQVPAAAAAWTDAYGPGSTTYAEQVPTVEPWTAAYGEGGTVYGEQVPSQATP